MRSEQCCAPRASKTLRDFVAHRPHRIVEQYSKDGGARFFHETGDFPDKDRMAGRVARRCPHTGAGNRPSLPQNRSCHGVPACNRIFWPEADPMVFSTRAQRPLGTAAPCNRAPPLCKPHLLFYNSDQDGLAVQGCPNRTSGVEEWIARSLFRETGMWRESMHVSVMPLLIHGTAHALPNSNLVVIHRIRRVAALPRRRPGRRIYPCR